MYIVATSKSNNLVILGLIFAMFVALPLFVWSLININLDIRERAQRCESRPACLDARPHPCLLPEPENGWCPQPTATAIATPTATASPTNAPIGGYTLGEPNSCGGTCGSNYNCKANLYCYKGYCRNPICSDDSDCNCSAVATTTPTRKPTAKPLTDSKGGVNSKPTIDNTTKPTQTTKSVPTSEPLLRTTEDLKAPENQFFAKYAMYIFGLFILIVISTIYYAVKKNNNDNNQDIPHIMPPTNI